MKFYIKNLLKKVFTLPLNLLPIQSNKIVFDNFGGRGLGDNPKYILEELVSRENNLDLVWISKDREISVPKGVRVEKYGSYRSFYEWLTARFWVDNIRCSDRPWKRKGQIYLQTWHGSDGVKLIEKSVAESLKKTYLRMAKYDGKITDGIVSSRYLQTLGMQNNFWLTEDVEFLEFGLPRNDDFFKSEKIKTTNIKFRRLFDIDLDELVVLYMPTFRDDGSLDAYNLDYSKLIHAFQNKFRKNVKILVRFHPTVDFSFINLQDTNCINVSTYSNPQDLMMSADVMITDYSSSSIDFMLLNRPVFLYLPDYQRYVNDRPLDNNFYKLPFPRAYHNNELIEIIRDFERSKYDEKVRLYELEDVRFDRGKSSVMCADWIEEKIKNNRVVD